MLGALEDPRLRRLAWKALPRIIDQYEPVGPLSASLALEAGINPKARPLIFPTSDDQQAGLVGGGAVDEGQVAVILGNSAVVNSSSGGLPASGSSRRHALELGSVPLDALLQQRRAIPRPGCGAPTRLGQPGTRGEGLSAGRGRHGRLAICRPRSLRWGLPSHSSRGIPRSRRCPVSGTGRHWKRWRI